MNSKFHNLLSLYSSSKSSPEPNNGSGNVSNKKTCGIYKITNTLTNEAYIGQSKNIEKRISTHKEDLENGTHVNKGLQEDYDLAKSLDSDYEIFSFEIIKEVKAKDLNKEEMYWINEFNSFERGYNKTSGGSHDETKGHVDYGGGRLFTDEKRIKLMTKELTDDFANKENYIFKTTSNEVLCSKCGKEFNDEFEFCPYCGTKKPQPKICPKCKLEPSIEFSFCPKCGTELVDKVEYLKKIEEIKRKKIEEQEENKRRKIEEQKQLKNQGLAYEKEGDELFKQHSEYYALEKYLEAKEIYKTLELEIYDSNLLFNLCEKLVKKGNTLFSQGKHQGSIYTRGAINYYIEAREICKSLDYKIYDTTSILNEIIKDINEKIFKSLNAEILNNAKKYEKEAYKCLLHGWDNVGLDNYEKAKATYENIDKEYYDAENEIRKCDEKIKELKINIKKY